MARDSDKSVPPASTSGGYTAATAMATSAVRRPQTLQASRPIRPTETVPSNAWNTRAAVMCTPMTL